MLMQVERERIVKYGQKMVHTQLTSGTGGNLSVIDREQGLVAISPTGIDYLETTPADVVIVGLDGAVVDGDKLPSSELKFHLGLYNKRCDIGAVVHTHSIYATTIACLGWELPAVHYMVGYSGTKVPISKYATFGSQDLAENIAESIGSYNGLLLANHGMIAVANNIATAFAAAEAIEFVARLYYQSKSIGDPVILNNEEMQKVMEKFGSYGQKSNS